MYATVPKAAPGVVRSSSLITVGWADAAPCTLPLEMRVQERLNAIAQGDEARGIPPNPTTAMMQYNRIMREEQIEDEPTYYGGGVRRRLQRMRQRPGRR